MGRVESSGDERPTPPQQECTPCDTWPAAKRQRSDSDGKGDFSRGAVAEPLQENGEPHSRFPQAIGIGSSHVTNDLSSSPCSWLSTDRGAPKRARVRFIVGFSPSAAAELGYPCSGSKPGRLRVVRANEWDLDGTDAGDQVSGDPHLGTDLFWEESQWTSLDIDVPADSDLLFCLVQVEDDPDMLQLHPWETQRRRQFRWDHEFSLRVRAGDVLEVSLSWPGGKAVPVLAPSPAQEDLVGRLSSQREGSQRCYTFYGPHQTRLDFSLYIPPGFHQATRPWPVLLFLHAQHARLDGDISLFFESEAPPQLLLGSHQCPESLRRDFVVLCPQCPGDDSQLYGSGLWFYTDWYGKRAYMPEVEKDLAALIETMVRHPRLDHFVAMTGTSMGGMGCLEFASRRPGLIKACVPVAAHYELDLDALVERLTKEQELPLWFFHAPEDTLCPCERIDTLVSMLRARSRAEVRFTRYRDTWSVNGHCADRVSYHIVSRSEGQEALGNDLFEWILQQRKSNA